MKLTKIKKINLKIVFGAIIILAGGWLGVQFVTKTSAPSKYFYNFASPAHYNETGTISLFNYLFSVEPLNALAASKTENGNVIKYVNAYTNTDVVQTKYTNKLKEDIILKQPGHPEKFTYQINLEQYDFNLDSKANIMFYRKGKKGDELSRLFTIPAPFMTDATGNKSSTNDVKMTLTDQGILTIEPNKDWLTKANYPVTLDPTIEINILNVHSHPQQGENWTVSFTTMGTADLKIIPNDQATTDDDEFVSLTCNGKIRTPQILPGDIIYYPNWQCLPSDLSAKASASAEALAKEGTGIGQVVHYTKKAGRHTLRFEFGDQLAYAYNATQLSLTWVGNDFQQTTSSITYTDSDTAISSASLPVGTYLVIWGAQVGVSNASASSSVQLVRGETEIAQLGGESMAVTNAATGIGAAGFWLGSLSGSEALTMRYRSSSISRTAYLGGKHIFAIRLDQNLTENTDYWTTGTQESDIADFTNLDTAASTTIKTLETTFNASQTKNYIVLASMEMAPNSASANGCGGDILIDGTPYAFAQKEGEQTPDWFSYVFARQVSIGSGSKSISLRGISFVGATCSVRRYRIYVFDASKFDQVVYATDATERTTTSLTPAYQVTQAYTPNQSETVLVLGTASLGSRGTGSAIDMDLYDSTNSYDYASSTGQVANNSTSDWWTNLAAATSTISANTTFNLRYWRQSGSATDRIRDGTLLFWSMTLVPSVPITVSGTLYSDEGTTALTTAGLSLKLAVGTSTPGVYATTTCSGCGGFWQITNVGQPAIGTPITAWVDNNGVNANTITKASSTSNNITGLNLYQNRIIIKHEATSGTSTTYADLAFYDADDEPDDLQFTANDNAINVLAGSAVYLAPGSEFSPGAVTVTTHSSSTAVYPSGDFKLATGLRQDGTATSSILTLAGAVSVAGSWFASSTSILNHGNQTITFTATTTGKTIMATSSPFYALTFNGAAGGWVFSANASTTSDFTISAGTVTAPALLTIAGSYTNNGDFTDNSGTIYFTGTDKTLSGQLTGLTDDFYNLIFTDSGSWTFSNNASTTGLTISSGTVTAPASGLVSIVGNYTNNGTFTANSSTVYLSGASQQTLDGQMTGANAFASLQILNSSGGGDATNSPSVIFSAAASAGTLTIATADVTARFLASTDYTFTNISWNGQNTSQPFKPRSSDSVTHAKWNLIITGSQAVSYVDFMDTNACSGSNINAYLGTGNVNSGNNNCINFTEPAAQAKEKLQGKFKFQGTVQFK